jgi:hypothetical protein
MIPPKMWDKISRDDHSGLCLEATETGITMNGAEPGSNDYISKYVSVLQLCFFALRTDTTLVRQPENG